MDKTVTIKLFGKPYQFKADADLDHAQKVADFLVSEVARLHPSPDEPLPDTRKFAILMSVALNISNEYIKMKERKANHTDQLLQRTRTIVTMLEKGLGNNSQATIPFSGPSVG